MASPEPSPDGRVTLVSCHHSEDLAWLRAQRRYAHVVCSKTDPTADLYLPRNVAHEAEAYLRFIIDRYDRLPEVAVFVHGHERADHQRGTVLELLDEVAAEASGDLVAAVIAAGGYVNINTHACCVVLDASAADAALRDANAWRSRSAPEAGLRVSQVYMRTPGVSRAFADAEVHRFLVAGVPGLDPPAPYVISKHSAQFAVHRDLLLARPREHWETLLSRMYALHDQCGVDSREAAIVFEVLWCALMTGRWTE